MSAPHPPDADPVPTQRRSFRGLLRVLGTTLFILSIVAAECLAAYFLLPSASDLTSAAEARLKRQSTPAEADDEEDLEKEAIETAEVELGTFSISSHQPAAGTALRIDFKLVGTINAADKAAYNELYAHNTNRLRDQVIFEIRSAEVNDLSDPGLGLIKRRILGRVNALLGKPLLQGVLVSDFSFVGA